MAHTATDMIRADHRTVERLYQQYQGGNGQVQQQHAVIEQICHELEVHAQLEESMFYPAIQAKMGSTGKDLVSEALKEHGEMKRLISQLRDHSMDETDCDKALHKLMRGVQRHVKEEENEMLPQAEHHLGGELDRIGAEMQQKKQKLASIDYAENQHALRQMQRLPKADLRPSTELDLGALNRESERE